VPGDAGKPVGPELQGVVAPQSEGRVFVGLKPRDEAQRGRVLQRRQAHRKGANRAGKEQRASGWTRVEGHRPVEDWRRELNGLKRGKRKSKSDPRDHRIRDAEQLATRGGFVPENQFFPALLVYILLVSKPNWWEGPLLVADESHCRCSFAENFNDWFAHCAESDVRQGEGANPTQEFNLSAREPRPQYILSIGTRNTGPRASRSERMSEGCEARE